MKLKHPYGGYLDGISMWCPTRQGCGGEGGGETKVMGGVVTVKVCGVVFLVVRCSLFWVLGVGREKKG